MNTGTLVGILVALAVAAPAWSSDRAVVGLKLIVVDKMAATGNAKVAFVTKDTAITKGVATEPAEIEVMLNVAYDGTTGTFGMPIGVGWTANDGNVAKYVNTLAPSGGSVSVAVIKPQKLLKVVARSLGDLPLDISEAPSGPVYVGVDVSNGGGELRHCTQFTACEHKAIAGGSGWKLVCRNGIGDETCAGMDPPTMPPCGEWGAPGFGAGEFDRPLTLATTANGDVLVADATSRVQRFDEDGTYLGEWGVEGTGDGELMTPRGLAVDANGDVYAADTGNHRIQKFDASGSFLLAWGSSGSGPGQFRFPLGVALDDVGSVYVADTLNARVQKFDATGTFISTVGSAGQFQYPHAVEVDSMGNLYVVDTENLRVEKFDTAGVHVGTWGSYGSGPGEFRSPVAIAIDSNDDVYVSDDAPNHRIQKFDSNGGYLLQWGSIGSGPGEFFIPSEIAVGVGDSVYVADTLNNRIQRFGCP